MSVVVRVQHQFDNFALDVQFEAPAGITVLFGRSGTGKTSVINAVSGLLQPDNGLVRVNAHTLLDTTSGINLPIHRRRIGYVFQEGRLFPHLTVQQNLQYGRWFARKRARNQPSDAAGGADMARVVEMLGIGTLLQRRPASLSGGEKQRVGIGRALLSNPSLILADEPLASLDEQRKAEILPYFERLRDELSIPMLYVSHALTEVARLATSVVMLADGRVQQVGAAQDVLADPQAVRGLGVREAGALLSATLSKQHADGLSELSTGGGALYLPRIEAPLGQRLRVRIAAHDVIISRQKPDGLSALNILRGTINELRYGEGPGAIVAIKIPSHTHHENSELASTASVSREYEILLARITRRSAQALGLQTGMTCYAITKSVAVAAEDIGA